jgi:hypothetical protein
MGNKRTLAFNLRLQGLTYAQIGRQLGISRQRVQQIVAPPPAIRKAVCTAANGCCRSCGIRVGEAGHIHHTGDDGENYNDFEALVLLCLSCHLKAHSGNISIPQGKALTLMDVETLHMVLSRADNAWGYLGGRRQKYIHLLSFRISPDDYRILREEAEIKTIAFAELLRNILHKHIVSTRNDM